MKGAHGLVGFATLPAYQMDGITGGAMGQLVIAENEEQLRAYCQAEQPYTILFEGEISRTDEVDIAVASNKTIIGCNGRASLNGIGFEGENVSNIIIRDSASPMRTAMPSPSRPLTTSGSTTVTFRHLTTDCST